MALHTGDRVGAGGGRGELMSKPRPWYVWREVMVDECADGLLALADEIERRGAAGLDADPGETSDWLRSEVEG